MVLKLLMGLFLLLFQIHTVRVSYQKTSSIHLTILHKQKESMIINDLFTSSHNTYDKKQVTPFSHKIVLSIGIKCLKTTENHFPLH